MKEKIYQVLLGQHVTEKAAASGHYIFKVRVDATKPEIKEAVETLFSVKVEKIQVQLYNGKRKMFKRTQGVRNRFKKAYLRLAAGDVIELGADG